MGLDALNLFSNFTRVVSKAMMWLSIPRDYFDKFCKLLMCAICGYDVSLWIYVCSQPYIFCTGVIAQTFVICHLMVNW